MSVSIPYAGTFCAFAKRSASSVVYAARFHIFAAGEVSRSKPSSLHVQLCPDLPDQITAMEFAESSCSGLSTCASVLPNSRTPSLINESSTCVTGNSCRSHTAASADGCCVHSAGVLGPHRSST